MQRQNGQRQKGSGFVLHRFIKGRCKQGDLEKAPEEVQVRLTSFSVTPEEQYDPASLKDSCSNISALHS